MKYTEKQLKDVIEAYNTAYKAANNETTPFTLHYADGWYQLRHKNPTYNKLVRFNDLKRMTEVLRVRAGLDRIYPEIELKKFR